MAICLSEESWIVLLLLDGGQAVTILRWTLPLWTLKLRKTFPTLGLWVPQRGQNNVRRRDARNIDTRIQKAMSRHRFSQILHRKSLICSCILLACKGTR